LTKKTIVAAALRSSSGQRLGPYEIQQPLGAGGMGDVYQARDTLSSGRSR
jgi:serine/threonine protein kinase